MPWKRSSTLACDATPTLYVRASRPALARPNARPVHRPRNKDGPIVMNLSRRLFLAMAAAMLMLTFTAQVAADGKRASISDFTLKNLAGKKVSLSDLKGKVVVISFWATWCKPCLQELPYLWEFQEKYEDDGLVVLAISTDDASSLSSVESKAKKWKRTYKGYKKNVLLDQNSDVIAKLNPRGAQPYTIFVDRKGMSTESHEGFEVAKVPEYEESIKKLLAEKP